MSLPESVQRILNRKGAKYHGAFRVVGNTSEAARWHEAKMHIPENHLAISVSVGGIYSPDRTEYLLSEPAATGKMLGVRAVSYETKSMDKEAA